MVAISTTARERIRRSGAVLLVLGLVLGMVGVLAGTAGATIAPSTFNAFDGNMTVEPGSPANTDWESVTTDTVGTAHWIAHQSDPTTGNGDTSFGGGTSEDDPNTHVVDDSIPTNKSDLTNFYAAFERVTTGTTGNFLYLAWSRIQAPSGTTNMDFELNQKAQSVPAGPYSGNGQAWTIDRTPGDILITYDLSQGGTHPNLAYLKWIDSGTCYAPSGKLPCWGDRQVLTTTSTPAAEGAVNLTSISNPVDGGTFDPLTFGEASINLDVSGIFPANQCVNFASAFLKSRSSDSFTAEIKDFVPPVNHPVSNCGKLTIVKDAQPNSSQAFSFRTAGGTGSGTTDTAYTLTDNGTDASLKSKSFTLFSGDYTTTETVPSNWALDSVTCADATAPSTAIGTAVANGKTVAVGPDSDITCTFVNKALPPDVRVRKTANPTGPVNAGQSIGFDIVVDNIGTGTATSVSLSDTLPTTSGTIWSVVGTGATCGITSGVLTCTAASLAPGASFTAHVSSPTTSQSCGTVNNTATVSATNEPSNVLSNNTDSDSVVVNCGAIHITKTAVPAGPVLAGQDIGFRIDVWKTGAGDVTSVTVHDALPTDAGTTWTVDNVSGGTCDILGSDLSCNFGTIADATTRTISLSSPTTTATCGTVDNTASVSTGNDGSGTSNASVVVTCPPDVTITKSGNGPLTSGQTAVWTIGVSNVSSGTATSVTVSDTLPAGITWTIDPAVNGCSITAGVLSCDFGSLAAGASRTVTVKGATTTASCPSIRNTATVAATNELEADQANNSASATINVTCPSPPPPPPPTTTTTEAPTTTTTQPPQVLPEVITTTTTSPPPPATTTTTIKVLGVQLARTGSDTDVWVRLAGIFLFAGGLLLLGSDRRMWSALHRR